MKRILAAVLVVVATTSLLAVTSAEAKRLGGGSSLGMKRAAPPPSPAAPAAAPQSAPAPAGTAAPPAPPPAAGGFSKWLGPLAGLGIGAGLMAMFGGGAMGGAIGSMFAMLALAALAFFVFQMFRRKSATAQSPSMHYAGAAPVEAPRLHTATVNPVADFPVSGGSGLSATSPAPIVEPSRYPQGFDAEEFVRQAKISFIRLQAANDTKDLRDIRDFTTPELYAELAMQIQERDNTPQRTDVVKLNAELLEAATEQDRIIASVRYTGIIREDAVGDAAPFSETWHVVKDLKHPTPTWHIAGIQQNS